MEDDTEGDNVSSFGGKDGDFEDEGDVEGVSVIFEGDNDGVSVNIEGDTDGVSVIFGASAYV